jgi:hypothetical protein
MDICQAWRVGSYIPAKLHPFHGQFPAKKHSLLAFRGFLSVSLKSMLYYSTVFVGCPRNKQKKNFGSNRNKPKQDLFRLFFGLFRDFQRIREVCTQKIVSKLSKIWVWDPGSEIRKNPISDPGPKGQKSTRCRIPDPDPQH